MDEYYLKYTDEENINFMKCDVLYRTGYWIEAESSLKDYLKTHE